ncbi:C40 family peptidase [Lacrimispora sp.]|uniref:C40 family peptidase n=1 Tax=Lacrimispora sp. TaxID=2719234 RepID=UPI0032E40096
MHKKTLIAVLFTGVLIAGSVSFPAKADTVSASEPIPLIEPLIINTVNGPGARINGPSAPNQSAAGDQVVSFARQFLGNPYRYGGTSLTEGADCSGFVQSVYKNFGINLPRTSQDQAAAGVDAGGIEKARPGDLVSYIGHIGIYIGNGQLIHASGPEDGIKISNVDFQPIQSVRRILNQ